MWDPTSRAPSAVRIASVSMSVSVFGTIAKGIVAGIIFYQSSFCVSKERDIYNTDSSCDSEMKSTKAHTSWHHIVQKMQSLCRERACEIKARRMGGYTPSSRGGSKFHGLYAPQIKSVFDEAFASQHYRAWSFETLFEMSTSLLSSEFFEEKKLGIILLQKRVREFRCREVELFAPVIDAHVNGWSTCDSISSSVIRHVAAQDKDVLPLLVKWSHGLPGTTRNRQLCGVDDPTMAGQVFMCFLSAFSAPRKGR